MCGPSASERQLEGQEQKFSQTLQNDYNTQFSNQQEILKTLNSTLQPIVEAGPSQEGFSPSETAALNTEAINTTGANYANAARAVGNQLAGRGGDSGLESGVDQQIKASLASKAAGQTSSEELGITEANYAAGRANWQTALAGEGSVAGMENPLGYAGAGTNANEAAFNEANTIDQQSNQAQADIAGGVTSLVGTGLSFIPKIQGILAGQGGGGGGSSSATLTPEELANFS